jgi:hypothetical protein
VKVSSHLSICIVAFAACGQKPLTAKQIHDQAYPVYGQNTHAGFLMMVTLVAIA